MQDHIKIRKELFKPGYALNIGNHKTAHARNLQEVVYALEHYFRDGAPGYSDTFDYQKHVAHNAECHCCPFCRQEG